MNYHPITFRLYLSIGETGTKSKSEPIVSDRFRKRKKAERIEKIPVSVKCGKSLRVFDKKLTNILKMVDM